MTPSPEWAERAACRGMDQEIFFPTQDMGYGPAREICDRCEVRHDCLTEALALDPSADIAGMFGGLTPTERDDLRPGRRVEHGTTRGWWRHYRDREQPCGPCEQAIRAYRAAKSRAHRQRQREAS